MKNYADPGGTLFIYIYAIKTNQRIAPRINSRRDTFTKMIVQFCFVFSLSRLLLDKLKIGALFKTDNR